MDERFYEISCTGKKYVDRAIVTEYVVRKFAQLSTHRWHDEREEKIRREEREDFMRFVFEMPIADVVPVVHGKWEKNHPNDNIVYCNQCAMPQDLPCNYCPCCGARMNEVDDG